MRFAERVESGWATMWIVALFAVSLLCLAVADGIREEREHRRADAREKARIEELAQRIRELDDDRFTHCFVQLPTAADTPIARLVQQINRLDHEIKILRVSSQCLDNPLAPGCW